MTRFHHVIKCKLTRPLKVRSSQRTALHDNWKKQEHNQEKNKEDFTNCSQGWLEEFPFFLNEAKKHFGLLIHPDTRVTGAITVFLQVEKDKQDTNATSCVS